jgi:hypothetical protein
VAFGTLGTETLGEFYEIGFSGETNPPYLVHCGKRSQRFIQLCFSLVKNSLGR